MHTMRRFAPANWALGVQSTRQLDDAKNAAYVKFVAVVQGVTRPPAALKLPIHIHPSP